MRPLNLRLQAFGSYAGEFEIDFSRLGRHGVFSITGPTGSGKSTIFDAIVYALYDDLPGFRSDSHIRSQYADEGTPTSVTFTFEADGREWVVERSPTQMRPRQRGSGPPVPADSRVVLKELGADGGGLTRKGAVADQLQELVGLNKAQFEQVVLIPQGKFEEVLKADTKDRALLLSRLFPVDIYRRTTESLRELAASRKTAYEGLSASSDALVEAIRTDIIDALRRAPDGFDGRSPDDPSLSTVDFDLAEVEAHRTELRRLAATMGATRDDARVQATAARSRRDAAEAQAARWEQWQADQRAAQDFPRQAEEDRIALGLLDRARTVARLGPALGRWRTATDALVKGEQDQEALRAALDADWADQYDRSALARATTAAALATVAEVDAAALESADAALDALLRRARDLDETDTRLAEASTAVSDSQAALTEAEEQLEVARVELVAQSALAAGRSPVEVRVNELERAVEIATTRASAMALVAQLESEVTTATGAEEIAAAHVATVRSAWRDGLAGRLAEHLVDGAPCPTCGSDNHPDPAQRGGDAPSDAVLENAEAAHRVQAQASQALRVRLAQATATLESLGADTDSNELSAQLSVAQAELAAIVSAEAEVVRRTAEVESKAQSLDTMRADIAQASAALQVDRATQSERRQQWENERSEFVAAHGSMTSTADAARQRRRLAEAIASLAASLRTSEASGAALVQSLDMLAPALLEYGADDPAELERWSLPAEEIEQHAVVLDQRAHDRRDVEGRIRSYTEDGGPEIRPDTEPLIEAARLADERLDDVVGTLAVVTALIESVETATEELATRSTAIDVARREKEEAETLAAACAGLVSGPSASRVSLENWVLAYYLRQVLAQANLRLATMTGGRYALELNQEYTDGRKPWGLDLSVLDAETGQSRPATTLSGGETFMAALSLALGLADVVSAGSNYTIGALFVDEGFGSLDGDSLDTVIEVLRSLQDGGRMVGVISHVQDLKDALPNGITIESTNQGSNATIHYPEE